MTKNTLADYTEAEFLEFVRKFFTTGFATQSEADEAIEAFVRLAEHPKETDLIYYPDDSRPDTPEGVVSELKAWRAANGKAPFKA